jgi:serine/threonine protein kinase
MPPPDPSMDFGPSTQQFDTVFSHEALPPGTTLGGYQILEVLGRGGFGIVYLAIDSSLQRQVAIKEYLPAELAIRCDDGQVWVKPGADASAYAAGKTAFLSEAKMLARFDHPSLARVHTFWEENRTAYMVMPYYDGRTLADLLAERGTPPDEAWLRKLLGPLLSALDTLHNAQCLHLDISPDNIIVMQDDRPVLLDFGIASRFATDKTLPLTALLNPAYAPIEQYSETASLPQGPWTDLYALASVLHFAMVGRPPARATVRAVEDPQRPLAESVAQRPGPGYSEGLMAAVDKALAVRPRDRLRSVAEFQMLMDRPAGAAAEPATARHAAPPAAAAPRAAPEPAPDAWFTAEPRELSRPPKRNHHPVLWTVLVVALGAAGVSGWAWLQRQPASANITAADLPAAVVAAVPKASAVNGLPAAAEAAPPSASAIASTTAAASAVPAENVAAVIASTPAPAEAASAAASPVTPVAGLNTQPAAPAPEAAAPTPAPGKKAVPKATPEPSTLAIAEASTPRAACGNRSNFALVYCMQQQCKKPRYTTHPQCNEMRLRGEL